MDRAGGVDRVVGALLRRGDRVLLVHRSPARRWYPDVWDVPGGHVEPGEDGASALVRELREELGIDADVSGEPFARVQAADFVMDVWVLDAWRGEPVNAAPEEHDAIAWTATDDLAGLRLAPHVRSLVRQVAGGDVLRRAAAEGVLHVTSGQPTVEVRRAAHTVREALRASGQPTGGDDDDLADLEPPDPRGADAPSVDQDVRDALAARARAGGQSLQAYLLEMVRDDARRSSDLAILERFRGRHDGASLPAGAAAEELRALRAEREASLSGVHDDVAP